MAGLLNAKQPDQQQASKQPQGKNEEVYKRLGLAAMKIIYTKPESDHVLEILRALKKIPSEAVAQAVFAVIKRMQNEIKGINSKMAFSVAPTLVALIFEMGMAAEIFTEESFSEDADPRKLIGESLSIVAKLERGAQPQSQAPQAEIQPQQPGVQNGIA